MTEPYLDFDPALLAEFIDESTEMLASLDSLFVQLEANPGDLEPVNAIFRPIHSIKGNSAFFGFNRVKSLSHEMESLLDKVRKKILTVSPPMISVLLEGVDALKTVFARARVGEAEIQDEEAFKDLVRRVKQAVEGGDTLADTLRRASALANEIKAKAGNSELAQLADALLAELAPVAGPVKAAGGAAAPGAPGETAALLQLEALLSQPIADVLPHDAAEEVRHCFEALAPLAGDEKTLALIKEALDAYDTFIASVGFDSLLQDILREKVEALRAASTWTSGAAAAIAPAPSEAAPPPPAAKAEQQQQQKTMRISESHIDTFLAYVGELIVVGDMFRHLQTRIASMTDAGEILSAFRHTSETFDALSSNLQSSIMSIRKLPVRSLLQKTPRLVRDIAASKGKQINVELVGENVEVDKSLTDLLDAPLTHMVRNAADHGIESPREREAAGKTPKGLIRVGVSEEDNEIVLSVADDGAGLNLSAIRAKAEGMGMIKPGQQLRESDIVNFIFSAGVSTAAEVSDVSGRGVGMDVVKSAIESNGGAISVTTESGKGSVFKVTLPKSVTTQIISGFLVEAAGQCYILQMSRVRETLSAHPNEIHSLHERGLCFKRHGELMPMVALRAILGLPEEDPFRNEPRTLVAIEAHKRLFALEVDGLLGVQQVVLRTIEGLDGCSAMIAGGALMGDGSVALVIDTDYVFDRRRKRETHEATIG